MEHASLFNCSGPSKVEYTSSSPLPISNALSVINSFTQFCCSVHKLTTFKMASVDQLCVSVDVNHLDVILDKLFPDVCN